MKNNSYHIPNRFSQKIVIVTGAESGIGRATATRFVREGAIVYGFGLREVLGKEWQGSVVNEPGEAHFVVCNVSQYEQVKVEVTKIGERHNRIAVLVNNAAKYF